MLTESDMPPLQMLVVFESSARHLSFTAAARELGTTQPAISQQVKALEGYLKTPLFKRVYRGVELTDAGHILLKTTQASFGEIRKTVTYIRKKNKTPRINVATDFAFSAYWLLPRLPDFRKRHPDIDIRLHTAQSNVDIGLSDADLAIVFSNGVHSGFYTDKLFEEDVYPICSPRLLEEVGPITDLDQITGVPLLKLNAGDEEKWMTWETLFQQHNTSWSPSHSVMEFDNYTLLVQAAIAGQGFALGWGSLIDDMIDKNMLVGLQAFRSQSHYGYFTVVPQPLVEDPIVKTFKDWIHSQND
ncbi:LysR substrate-binding domain-containing protein [Marinomonas mediterranea]|uniref:Transcriptional regulator, LysR family n=1 Tax=Marinomonas mediterranea (strain ATCC 700492 / JCM 21426 / NBRC 103028 / MMB-1) TaxID=717774 RepID=F2JYJ8_MARM1|nr:LysR substrate-binding domain-containing protein [Marinomonas mediterranea]ADZ93127.1 transcriptional regulator, LysR family [Marinomonas mediterranea MMB-1]WCN19136.1 LysR family transcriptional regulator [Marinomonas mediterranea MMB-1]